MATNKKIYVLGAGGHAKVVIDALRAQDFVIGGLIDPNHPVGTEIFGCRIIGGDEVITSLPPEDILLANGVGATPKSRVNARLFAHWTSKGYCFVTVRHPSAVVADSAVLLSGCQVMAGAIIQPDAIINPAAVINTGARVDHDCQVGRSCFIAPSVTLCGGVKVGDGGFIGAGAVILPGLSLGDNVLVAAGAIVDCDIANGEFFGR